MEKKILLFSQTRYNPFIALARDVLTRYHIPFQEINIEADPQAADRLAQWRGEKITPTLVALPADLSPSQLPPSLPPEAILSTPTNRQLEDWLFQHGLLDKPYRR